MRLPAASARPNPVTPRCLRAPRPIENGRTWVGFKSGGLPPDSLSKSSEAVTCVEDDR